MYQCAVLSNCLDCHDTRTPSSDNKLVGLWVLVFLGIILAPYSLRVLVVLVGIPWTADAFGVERPHTDYSRSHVVRYVKLLWEHPVL